VKRVLEPITSSKIQKIAKKLIRIRSISGREAKIQNSIATDLQKAGITVKEVPPTGSGRNLIAELEFSKEGPRVMLGGNVDTLPLDNGETKSSFKPNITNDRLYGVGSRDSKVGLATIISVFKALRNAPVSLRGSLVLCCISDGKGWNTGVNSILERGFLDNTNFCIMCKPTAKNSLLIGRLGRVFIRVKITNKKQRGLLKKDNVILNASSIITAIASLQLESNSQYKVQGKIKPREIHARPLGPLDPESCEFTLDINYSPNESIPRIINKIKKTLHLSKTGLDAKISLLPMQTPPPKPYLLKSNHNLVRVMTESFEKTLSKKPIYQIGKQAGDENFLHHAQIPTITFGPQGSKIGNSAEFVEIGSIEPTAHIITRAVLNLLK
jgi:acetylornithine deacetylase/succinyl-diaminopimelate desuccinylase-like protein